MAASRVYFEDAWFVGSCLEMLFQIVSFDRASTSMPTRSRFVDESFCEVHSGNPT